MAVPSLTLHKVSDFYKIPEECVLLYEREGLVFPLITGNERYYTARDRVRIEVILKGKKLGFSLLEIKSLINAHLPAPRTPNMGSIHLKSRIDQLEHEKAALQAAIDRLQGKMDDDS